MLRPARKNCYSVLVRPTTSKNIASRSAEASGSASIPIMEMTLDSCIEQNGMLPNFRARFCTRQIKIEPARRLMQRLAASSPVTHYVGLRADEETRIGGVYDDIAGLTNRFPMREWGWGIAEVKDCLQRHGVAECLPKRTDCALCYHQRIGEWYQLWKNHPEEWAKGVAIEEKYGHTFRSPGRDTWPVSMIGLSLVFASGRIPKSEQGIRTTQASGACRVCSL